MFPAAAFILDCFNQATGSLKVTFHCLKILVLTLSRNLTVLISTLALIAALHSQNRRWRESLPSPRVGLRRYNRFCRHPP